MVALRTSKKPARCTHTATSAPDKHRTSSRHASQAAACLFTTNYMFRHCLRNMSTARPAPVRHTRDNKGTSSKLPGHSECDHLSTLLSLDGGEPGSAPVIHLHLKICLERCVLFFGFCMYKHAWVFNLKTPHALLMVNREPAPKNFQHYS